MSETGHYASVAKCSTQKIVPVQAVGLRGNATSENGRL